MKPRRVDPLCVVVWVVLPVLTLFVFWVGLTTIAKWVLR